jgi:hypothetical protein
MQLFEQIERSLSQKVARPKAWKVLRGSNKWAKQKKHRIERQRAKREPDCTPCYRKYCGWEC